MENGKERGEGGVNEGGKKCGKEIEYGFEKNKNQIQSEIIDENQNTPSQEFENFKEKLTEKNGNERENEEENEKKTEKENGREQESENESEQKSENESENENKGKSEKEKQSRNEAGKLIPNENQNEKEIENEKEQENEKDSENHNKKGGEVPGENEKEREINEEENKKAEYNKEILNLRTQIFARIFRTVLYKWKEIPGTFTSFQIFSSYMRRFCFVKKVLNIDTVLFIEEESLVILGTNLNSCIILDLETCKIIKVIKPELMDSCLLPVYLKANKKKMLLIFGRKNCSDANSEAERGALIILNIWNIREEEPKKLGNFEFEVDFEEILLLRREKFQNSNQLDVLLFTHSCPLFLRSLKLCEDGTFKALKRPSPVYLRLMHPKRLRIKDKFIITWDKGSPFIVVSKIMAGSQFCLKKLKSIRKLDKYTIHCIVPSKAYKNILFTCGAVHTVVCWNFFKGQALYQVGKDIPLCEGSKFYSIEMLRIKLQYADRMGLIEYKGNCEKPKFYNENTDRIIYEIIVSGLDNETWWVGHAFYEGNNLINGDFKFLYTFNRDEYHRDIKFS